MELRERREKRFGRVFIEEGRSLRRLGAILSTISEKYSMDEDKMANIISKRAKYASIPVDVFNNSLSPLENVVLYMHLKLGLSQARIAEMLARDHTTIWTTLENALKKADRRKYGDMDVGDKRIAVPISIFANRQLSILENLSIYIKDRFKLSYHEIALLLGKNDRTIWTVVSRAKKKGTIL